MPLLFEIKVRINGEERWADARKMFDYLYKECINENYRGDGEIPLNSEEKNEQFMSWWNLYAKKTDKKKTQKYWNRNIKQKDFDKIISLLPKTQYNSTKGVKLDNTLEGAALLSFQPLTTL